MAFHHGMDRIGILRSDPGPLGVLIHNERVAVAILARQQHDSVMAVAIVHGGEPFGGATLIELADDMGFPAERGEELAGGDVPATVQPGAPLPAGMGLEFLNVAGIHEFVVRHSGRDEPGIGLLPVLERNDELGTIPDVTDPSGIGGGVHARPPGSAIGHEFGTAVATGDVLVLFGGERSGFLNTDHVVFKPEIGIDVVFVLEMADDHAGAIGKGEDAFGRGEGMFHLAKDLLPEVAQGFEIGFTDFAEHERFETGHALAIVEADLGDEPMRFAATASTAVTDFGGAIGKVTEASRSTGGELAFLEEAAGGKEAFDLVHGAAGFNGEVNEVLEVSDWDSHRFSIFDLGFGICCKKTQG